MTSNPRDDSLFYFLSTYTYSTPRVTVGVMIVQKVNCYEIIYISPYQEKKKAAKCYYTPAVLGGNFHLKISDFRTFPFLIAFVATKVKATIILKYLNESKIIIAEQAVKK